MVPGITLLIQSLFQPTRLGRELDLVTARLPAMVCATIVRLIACAAIGLAKMDKPDLALIAAAGVFLASWFCEWLIAWLFTGSVLIEDVPRQQHLRYWHTLCHCFSTHLLITAACGVGGLFLLPRLTAVPLPYYGLPLVATAILNLAYWWNNLGRAILARSVPGPSRTMNLFMIPLIGGLGYVLCAFVILLYRYSVE